MLGRTIRWLPLWLGLVPSVCLPGVRAAEEDSCCPPTLTRPPVRIFPQPPEQEPVWEKPQLRPAPKLFTMEQAPPRYVEAPPPPPVKVFTVKPPEVKFFTLVPPVPKLFRMEDAPPVCVEAPPRPPLRLFGMHPTAPGFLPSLCQPAVTVVVQPQPCPAEPLSGCPSQP